MRRVFTSVNILIITLSLLTFLISALPVWFNRGPGVFFEADPDFVYLSNSIMYIKSHQINYHDHPGTPAIRLLSTAFFPIRLYAKFIAKQPFVIWFINHPDFIYLFARLFQSALVSLAIFVLLRAVHKNTSSLFAPIFLWSALYSFTSLPYAGANISAEAANLLLLSLTIFLFVVFNSNRSPLVLPVLSFFAGLALSNRLTNLFYLIGILSLSFFLTLNFRKKTLNFVFNTTAVILGFLFGSWPIRGAYTSLFSWILRLATSSQIHGNGQKSLFDLSAYSQSVLTLWNQQQIPIVLMLLTIFIALYSLIRKDRNLSIITMLFGSVFGSLVFAKYPLAHYHLPNFVIISFVATILLAKFARFAMPVLALFIILNVIPKNINSYFETINSAAAEAATLQSFIDQHPFKNAVVWEWGRARDFSFLWGRSWTGGSFDEELGLVKPNLWELDYNFDVIRTRHNTAVPVFDSCWDQLYIQQVSATVFLNKYPDTNLSYQNIPGTRMAFITSDHCLRPNL